MANFSSLVYDPDTNQLRKKSQPLIRPADEDVFDPGADQPYGFGIPNDQQPIGGNPATMDITGSNKGGYLANSGLDPEFVKRASVGSSTLDSGTGQPADRGVDSRLLSGMNLPTQPQIPGMQREQVLVNQIQQSAADKMLSYHPSKLRQFMGGLAGVGTGIMTHNPMAGYGAYKGVVDSPKEDIANDAAIEAQPHMIALAGQKDLAGIQSTFLQRLAEMSNADSKFNPNSSESITANARRTTADTGAKKWSFEQDHPETRNIEVGDPNVPGGKVPGTVGTRSGTVPFTQAGPTITPTPPRGFEPKQENMTLKDGSTVVGRYDPNTGKTTDASTGEDITSKLSGVGQLGDTNLREHMALWAQDFQQKNGRPPATNDKLAEERSWRLLSSTNTFNMNNPTADPQEVKYWADQVTKDSKNYSLISNKNVKSAVDAELAKRGTDINQLDAQTRETGKWASVGLKHVKTVEDLISNLEKRGQLGVAMSRWNAIMSGKIGADQTIQDKDLKNTFIALADNTKLLGSALARIHGGARGASSPAMISQMNAMLNAGTMDPNTLRSALGVFKDWMGEYAQMGGQTGEGGGPAGGGGAVSVQLKDGRKGQIPPDQLQKFLTENPGSSQVK